MWSSDMTVPLRLMSLGLVILLASCTVKPLNATSSNTLSADGTTSSVRAVMKTITVSPVKERVAQQVRNNLLFQLNGGQLESGGQYNVKLSVVAGASSLAVEGDSLSATSAQASVTANYTLVDTSDGKTVSSGMRRAVASFDQTPQKFANERARRDAENRAAKEAALQVRLAIAQALTASNR